jgi:hypothetical protein
MIIAMTGKKKKRNNRQRLYSERKCEGEEEGIALHQRVIEV